MSKANNQKAMMDGYKLAQAFVNKKVMDIFESICNSAIDVAIEKHKFNNRSLNLENSFSYAIYHNGKMMKFASVGSGDGASKAQLFCTTYKAIAPWSAVIVAGAWYGALIEGHIRGTGWGQSGGGAKERLKGNFEGETLTVLSDAFNFVSLEWIRDVKRHATA